jgi:hypothetical protein
MSSPLQIAQNPNDDLPEIDLPLEFSFWDDVKSCFKPLDSVERVILLQTLRIHYPQVESITIAIPYLIIECEESVPQESEQVFMAAGLVCVFIVAGGRYPFGVGYIGASGEAPPPQDIPDEVKKDIRAFHIPTLQTFAYIHKAIPSCSHVSSYATQLVVELHPLEEEEFQKQLIHLPGQFGSLSVGYINGTLLQKAKSRAKNPDLTNIDGEYDDSDYLAEANGKSLRPGVILECRNIPTDDHANDGVMWTNSGVKVYRRDEVRITCAKHGWDGVEDKKVYHAGQCVGTITDCLLEDIGLFTSTVPFLNHLLDINVTAKRLRHSSLISYGQWVVIDSAYTSKQRMRVFGLRVGKKRPPPGYDGPSGEYEYVQVDQVIFSVRADVINREPKIRDGVCGTPILLQGRTLVDQSDLHRGEVVGFMHYTNVVGCDNGSRLFSYCQPVDPLITDGWDICQD